MKVEIKIVGALLKPTGKSEFTCECRDGITVGELLVELKYGKSHLPHIMASIGGEKKNHAHVVKDGDAITLSTLVGGG